MVSLSLNHYFASQSLQYKAFERDFKHSGGQKKAARLLTGRAFIHRLLIDSFVFFTKILPIVFNSALHFFV